MSLSQPLGPLLLLSTCVTQATAQGLPPLAVPAELLAGSQAITSPVRPQAVDTSPLPAAATTTPTQPPSPTKVSPASTPSPVASLPDEPDFPGPVRLTAESRQLFAEQMTGVVDDWLEAQGEVELRRGEDRLFADGLSYRQAQDEVEASGNVRLERGADRLSGPRMRLRLEGMTGVIDSPSYTIRRPPKQPNWQKPRPAVSAHGRAERIELEGEDRYRLFGATFSTCQAGRQDWYAQADEMELDYQTEEGTARSARVIFQDTPILWAPWLSFPLNDQRKSGFLAPTFGSSSKSGIELTVPWYWNIAPNLDATFSPRLLTRRGLQLNSEFRYLAASYQGQLRGEYLPHDNLAHRSRSGYALVHKQNFGPLLGGHLSGELNLNGVSDDNYFSDLSTRLSAVTQGHLLRQGILNYGSSWWQAALNVQRYQTLQDPSLPPGTPPYQRLPQLTLNANRYDLPASLAVHLRGEFVRFSHPTQLEGRRLTLYPQISLPWQTSAFSITPKLGWHFTRYDLDRPAEQGAQQLTRHLPIFSLDAQVTFERPIDWFGEDLIQTLEPRLYYLRAPHREQNAIPVFDSGAADFNFAQIFAENRYVGGDRINDANQLTLVAVSRLIDPTMGSELLRAALGQRLHFGEQRVMLPGETARPGGIADFLAALSGRIAPQITADFALQYDPRRRQLERLNLGGRWQPSPGRLINTSYRYTREALGNIDVSAQWPLGGGWHGVGRYNWSTKEKRAIELIGGVEYDAGCWIARGVFQRLATQVGNATTAFFVQLELAGFSRIGSNPLELLRRNIPGYGVINQPTADPVFAAQ